MRSYDNRRRAAAAQETRERILDVVEGLLVEVGLGEITLPRIATAAGVTQQTVLRHHGSRDGCVLAVAERVRARIHDQRGQTAPGDVEGAVRSLVDHYEAEGRLVWALLAQERSDAFAQAAVAEGRATHRGWVCRCFQVGDDEARVDALVGATDLYLWRLYRVDLGRSRQATEALILRHVRALLEA